MRENLFYRPEGAWSGDYIPFYWEGEFHLFYLKDWRDPAGAGEGVAWYHISTRDFVHYTDHGEALARGTAEEPDLYVFTGSVIRAKGQFHIFYTGHNPHLAEKGLPMERVLHAVSDDLVHWEKRPEDAFLPPVELGYEKDDWRDPFVFESDGRYSMYLAARRSFGPLQRRGCTALAVSDDLVHWTVQEPVWSPELYYTHECPDRFRMGDWEYLIYSEFSDVRRTRYVMRRGEGEPWRAPADDRFDTSIWYAAKSWANEKGERYIFGWNATREGNKDAGGIQWGGNLAAHRVTQRPDGTLALREPEPLAACFAPLCRGQDAVPAKEDGMALSLLGENLPDTYRMTCHCRIVPGARRAGLALKYDPDTDTGMGIFLEPDTGAIHASQVFLPSSGNTMGMSRPLPGGDIDLTLLVDHTLYTLYAGNEVAFSGRAYDAKGTALAAFAQYGQAEFTDVRFWKLG